MSQIYVPPSQLPNYVTTAAGHWQRGIPDPGVPLWAIPAVGGLATCRNLIENSPPTLLELYEVYSYSIAWTMYLTFGAAPPAVPNVTAELALLVNDEVRYVVTQGPVATLPSTPGVQHVASGSWVSDLINPISLGARDRLGLRLGFLVDQVVTTSARGAVGVQSDPTPPASASPFQSTLSLRTLARPGNRIV